MTIWRLTKDNYYIFGNVVNHLLNGRETAISYGGITYTMETDKHYSQFPRAASSTSNSTLCLHLTPGQPVWVFLILEGVSQQ